MIFSKPVQTLTFSDVYFYQSYKKFYKIVYIFLKLLFLFI